MTEHALAPTLPHRRAQLLAPVLGILILLLLTPRAWAARPGSAGLELDWAFAPQTPAAVDRGTDVAVDSGGDVLLCGRSVESGRVAALLVKIDGASGDVAWQVRFDPTLDDRAASIVVDEAGASYMAGNTTPSPPFPDVLLAKHDASGRLVWAYSYDEFDNNDEGVDVALGPDDSVVVTGHANGLQGANFFTAKLTRDGDVLWTRQLDGGEGSQTDEAVAVAVGPSGEVFVTGTSRGPATDHVPDMLTAKYSADGDLLWTRRHDGSAGAHDTPTDLAADADGSVVVVGMTQGAQSSADAVVLRYAADGTLDWIADDLGGSRADTARAVVLDGDGAALVTGSTFTGRGGFDVLVAKVARDGRVSWRVRWDGGEKLGDAGQAVALDAGGRVLVGATSARAATETDVSTLVLDARRGRVLATASHDGDFSFTEAPLAIQGQPDGGIVLGGFTNFPFEDLLALRYAPVLP